MSVATLTFYAEDDPLGTPIGTLTDAELEIFEVREALWEMPAAHFRLPRNHSAITSGLIADNNYVTVTYPFISANPVFGFWLKDVQAAILSHDEEGGEYVQFGGPGVLGVLEHMRLWHSSAVDDQPSRGSADMPGRWWWINEPYGAILTRVIEEGQEADYGGPLADVTIDFDRVNDSDSNAWPNIDAEFEVEIGTDGLSVMDQLRDAGDLYIIGHPDLLIQAFNAYGTDRSGSFGAGNVRFEKGVNILTELTREGHMRGQGTHLLLRDKDGNYSTEVSPDYSAGDRAHHLYFEADQTNDDTLLNKIGQEVLAASRTEPEKIELEYTVGNDEANGRYLPWLHFNVGDQVTLHTGTGILDYNEATHTIVAFRVELDEAADDTSTTTQYRSIRVVVELNHRTRHQGPVNRLVPTPADPGGWTNPLITGSGDGQDDDGEQQIAVLVGSEPNRVMYVATMLDAEPTVAWHPSFINAGTPGAGTSLTLVDSQVITGSVTIYLFRLLAPATSVETTSAVVLSKGVGKRAITGVWVVAGVDQSTPETDVATSSGTGTTSSVTVTPGANDLIIDVAGWAEANATVTTPSEAGDQTQDFARTYDRTFGFHDYALGGSHGSDATPAWSFTNSHTWGALAWAVKTSNTGATTQPVGGTGSGTVGSGDGTYVGPAHVHEHGNITTGGPYHMAEDVTFSPTGTISSTNVQAAIAEVASEAGVTDHGALTGLTDDDHTQYVRKTDGGKEVVNTVASSGTTETLNLTSGNVHDVTLTDNCTFTFAGATNGVACSFTLLLRQDGSGGRTATWPGSVEWPDSTAPTLATAANAVDILTFLTLDGGTTWFGQYAGAGGVTPESVRDAGRWEVVVSGTPATEVTTEDTTDWVYAWVTD